MTRRRLILIAVAVAVGFVAAAGAGYVAAGTTGLVDATAVAVAGALLLARGTIREQTARPVRSGQARDEHGPAVRAAEFAAYQRIASDLEWASLSRRHYDSVLRPMLARLAAALGRPAPDPGGPPGDGPGPDLAALDRVITALERSEP